MEKPADLTAEQLARPIRTADLPGLMSVIAPIIANFVGKAIAPLQTRIRELEAGGGIRYQGTWQAPNDYSRGMMVTFDGGIWHCNVVTTRDKPGTSSSWTLALKSKAR